MIEFFASILHFFGMDSTYIDRFFLSFRLRYNEVNNLLWRKNIPSQQKSAQQLQASNLRVFRQVIFWEITVLWTYLQTWTWKTKWYFLFKSTRTLKQSIEQRLLNTHYLIFSQLLTGLEMDYLMEGLLLQASLTSKIVGLQNLRSDGIKCRESAMARLFRRDATSTDCLMSVRGRASLSLPLSNPSLNFYIYLSLNPSPFSPHFLTPYSSLLNSNYILLGYAVIYKQLFRVK